MLKWVSFALVDYENVCFLQANKKYLKEMTGVNGPLLLEPEDFTKALRS